MDFLARLRPGGDDLAQRRARRQYALRAREAGLAVVISDLMDPAGYERGLKALLEHRFDVHVIHLLAADEMKPSFGRRSAARSMRRPASSAI